jgi:hypothetical protein
MMVEQRKGGRILALTTAAAPDRQLADQPRLPDPLGGLVDLVRRPRYTTANGSIGSSVLKTRGSKS